MKYCTLILVCSMLISFSLMGQHQQDTEVEKAIRSFFEGFHQRDSLLIKANTTNEVTLQSVYTSDSGQAVVQREPFSKFLKSISSIPADRSFEERLTGMHIQTDGPMAHAWVNYEFWLDGALRHCGVNSFHLIQEEGKWKILSVIDTRRKPCQQ